MSCLDCNRGSILEGQPTGSFTDIDGVKGGRAVILLGDGFGLPLELACDPLLDVNGMTDNLLPKRPPLWDKIKFVVMILLPRSGLMRRAALISSQFIKRIREQWKYDRIGAVGYCFGGPLGVRLAPLDIFDSLVVCHPGWVSEAEVKAINVPTSWVCAEEDITFGPAIRNQAEALLAAREGKDDFVDYEFVDYKGTVHGFACQPPLEFPDVKEAFEKSIDQTLKWFEKTLLVT
ncbi:uncharacterized protein EDB91DRAFT_1328558 [Suillus paluster]|uniref:uncharacterized protein n=1 Tax=Suillus paluster TaxID=48578 RepID=UPI001B87F8FE|nr:uncharacterized protein EDB91DRAFT_1328558 [Suillus paluster]KAG1743306.1 hypothetical protein EDB91DRAFT_1328558 [Suillus paluster]